MKSSYELPTKKESFIKRGLRAGTALVAITTLAACSDKEGSSNTETTATTGVNVTMVSASEPTEGDPRAFQCVKDPNPYPGTFQECPIPDGNIIENGVPVFRYTNLSEVQEPIAYSSSEPTFISCRIPEELLPASMPSLNGGGLYVLAGDTYENKAVVAANNFYNPSLPPNEVAFDSRVSVCSQATIAAVTAG